MRLTIRFQLTALATGLLLIGAGCNRPAEVEAGAATESPASGQTSAGKTRVVAGPPQRKTISLSTTQPGRILPFEEAPLAPRVHGYVE